jgi:chromosome segregation ATPase
MGQEMSFAQALNEAKGIILQQSQRIKADAEKIKSQQQTIVDQVAAICEHEKRERELDNALKLKSEQFDALESRFGDVVTARDQAEALINRQGERITGLQTAVQEMERHVVEQAQQINEMRGRCDALTAQVPTREDTEALYSLTALLNKKTSANTEKAAVRIAEAA